MKKLFLISSLALLLGACGGETDSTSKEKEKEDISVETEENKNEPTQAELDAKLKEEAIQLNFVAANTDEVAVDTKVFIKGEVTSVLKEGVGGEFTVTTSENDGYGMFSVENYALADVKEGDEISVYGVYKGKNDLLMPTITATLVE